VSLRRFFEWGRGNVQGEQRVDCNQLTTNQTEPSQPSRSRTLTLVVQGIGLKHGGAAGLLQLQSVGVRISGVHVKVFVGRKLGVGGWMGGWVGGWQGVLMRGNTGDQLLIRSARCLRGTF